MKKLLFNPLTRPFTVTYDIHGTGQPESYTIEALDLAEFEEPIASHVLKHLANEVYNQRGPKINPEQDITDISKEIDKTSDVD